MLCSTGYAQEINKEGPVEELLRMRQQNYELAQGLSVAKRDLAIAEAERNKYQALYAAEKPPWYISFLKSSFVDFVIFVAGTYFGIQMSKAA